MRKCELARVHAADIERILSVSILQLLSPKDLEDTFDTPVTFIDKKPDLGLQWAELGTIFRLPRYRSFEELIATAPTLQARVVDVDLSLLQAAGPFLVAALHAVGMKVFGSTTATSGRSSKRSASTRSTPTTSRSESPGSHRFPERSRATRPHRRRAGPCITN